ncbi:DNA translocase FtsK [Methylocucumis oryzae]|uniref:DNA translocase FtsK n=1 Tax=Methylocucumis oryzae TaxID=1632867 RepID=A0A0F3IM80_9GAMM|nr:DNA translocase FtsK [Methylocucumis oryzae]KJV06644.1 cell division protein FtsK [Methylocucumis oryzae]
MREIAVLGLLAGALFLLISLFTFSIEDAGWTHSGTGQPIRNAGGVIGAWIADISLSFFGLTAYLFPVIIVWQSVLLYKRIPQTREQLFIICLGIIAFITATAALLHLYMLRVGIELPRATGGILGEETGEKALNLLGNSGATIFLLVLLLASITLVTEFSWVKLIDNVGKYVLSLTNQVWSWLTQLHLTKPTLPTLPTPSALEAVFDVFSSSEDTPAPTKPALKTKPAASPAQVSVASQHTIVKRPVVTYDASQGVLPSLELLDDRVSHVKGYSQAELEDMSRMVESILNDFNVSVSVVGYLPGPVITRFELQPAAGVKVSRISTLAKDLARALLVTSVRIVEIIPGKSVVGLEIPNREREMVNFRELMASPTFTKAKSLLTLGLGKDIAGVSVVADLAKMPHALVAGTTGSGKSVAINAMILSLLYKATPQQVRMIMIDPKMLELSVYEGIPHLLTPVVTDMKEASNALRWAVAEMERRYKLMSKVGVRNLAGFNQLIEEMAARGEAIKDPLFASLEPYVECPELTTLPSIVIIIDELADMMMIVGKKVEELIARLAQKARAAGIHLILATQRPSVDVLTGLIKANVPTRISFQVSSRIDSRTILDQGGAEALLGNGDMLFLPSGTSIPIRAHGAFVDDHEVHRVVEFLKLTAPPDYLDDITKGFDDNGDSFSFNGGGFSGESSGDEYYDQAVRFVTESRKASISSVQRRFKIGYNRAASIIEEMEKAGIVSPAETNGSRVVLAPPPPND